MAKRFPQPGEFFEGRYAIDEVLAQTGFSRVYRATDTLRERQVALKLARPDIGDPSHSRSWTARFRREARLVSQLRDDHTVTLFDHGETSGGMLFMSFEFIEGRTLREVIRDDGPLSADRTIELLRQVLGALGEAHELGVLHRDLKPANIMLHVDRLGCARAKVLDFGIAKPNDDGPGSGEDLTAEGTILGTPRYMAPEQLRGQPLGPFTDIYSLGLIAFEMLTGRQAISATDTIHIIREQLDPAAIVLPGDIAMPTGLRALVERMLHKIPGGRYGSTRDLDEALAGVVPFGALPPISGSLDDATEVLSAEPTPALHPGPAADHRLIDFMLDEPTEIDAMDQVASVDSSGRVIPPSSAPPSASRGPTLRGEPRSSTGAAAKGPKPVGLDRPDERPVAGPQRTDAGRLRFATPAEGTTIPSSARSGWGPAIGVAAAVAAALALVVAIGAWIVADADFEGADGVEAQWARIQALWQSTATRSTRADSRFATEGIIRAASAGSFEAAGSKAVEFVGEIEHTVQPLRRGGARLELRVLLLPDEEAAERQVEGTTAPARAVRFGRKAAVILPSKAVHAEAAADLAALLERYRAMVGDER